MKKENWKRGKQFHLMPNYTTVRDDSELRPPTMLGENASKADGTACKISSDGLKALIASVFMV